MKTNNLKKIAGSIIPPLGVFLGFQMLIGFVLIGIYIFIMAYEAGRSGKPLDPDVFRSSMWTSERSFLTVIAISMILSEICAVLFCWHQLKMINMKLAFNVKGINWRMACVAIMATTIGIIACDLLSELLNLPNYYEDFFKNLSHNFFGILFIAVIGPIIEELIFREAILGSMLSKGVKTWTAIIVSAIVFGVIHWNPAQIPFATVFGILLAIIYYKTGNIVITSIIHILNNSLSVLQYNLLGDKADSFSFTEWMGGDTVGVAVFIVGASLCILLLRIFWKDIQEPVDVHDSVYIPNDEGKIGYHQETESSQ